MHRFVEVAWQGPFIEHVEGCRFRMPCAASALPEALAGDRRSRAPYNGGGGADMAYLWVLPGGVTTWRGPLTSREVLKLAEQQERSHVAHEHVRLRGGCHDAAVAPPDLALIALPAIQTVSEQELDGSGLSELCKRGWSFGCKDYSKRLPRSSGSRLRARSATTAKDTCRNS